MQLKNLLAVAGLASLATAQNATNGTLPTLMQALNSSMDLSALSGILAAQPSLVGALGMASNITILAPNNAALTAFMNTTAGMMATQDQISAVLSYHVLMGAYPAFNATAPTFVPTMLTNMTYSNVTGGQRVMAMNRTIYSGLGMNSSVVSTVNFTGGTIHIINRVLTIPPPVSMAATAYNLTSFTGALAATNLTSTANGLVNATIFVPNNAAFSAIGSALPNLTMAQIMSILTYHIVPMRVGYSTRLMNGSVYTTAQNGTLTIGVNNGSYFVNNARVILPNILVSGGVIHVIDQVLNPMMTMLANSTATAGMPAYSGASSVTNAPYTSGQPTPTSSINTGSIVMTATGGASATSSSGAAWAPRATGGAIGAAALGGLALIMQL